jgi:hypothetical protein
MVGSSLQFCLFLLKVAPAAMSQISSMVEETLGGIDRELASSLTQKQESFDHWHTKIRESAKARQIEQKQYDELRRKSSERVELDRRIKNLERSSEGLLATVKNTPGLDATRTVVVGDADLDAGIDINRFEALFPEGFNPASGFSEQQIAFLSAISSIDALRRHAQCYKEFNRGILAEVDGLKAKNAVLGQNYRRMVMACTGWTAEQVDEAAEGLTQCVKELNDNPVPEDEAIEILMRDRGQDW